MTRVTFRSRRPTERVRETPEEIATMIARAVQRPAIEGPPSIYLTDGRGLGMLVQVADVARIEPIPLKPIRSPKKADFLNGASRHDERRRERKSLHAELTEVETISETYIVMGEASEIAHFLKRARELNGALAVTLEDGTHWQIYGSSVKAVRPSEGT